MKFPNYEPLVLHLFKIFKRGLKPKNDDENSKQKSKDGEDSLDQDKQPQSGGERT